MKRAAQLMLVCGAGCLAGAPIAMGDSCDDHDHLQMAQAAATTTAAAPGPGPDRVAFPKAYRSEFKHYASRDRVPKKQIVEAFANPVAVDSARTGSQMADGSVLVMEIYKAAVDGEGEAKKQSDGRFVKGDLAAVVVMEKRAGWGQAYGADIRNGDWEYAKFKPTGEATGADTKACFECHKPLESSDFVFTFSELDAVKP